MILKKTILTLNYGLKPYHPPTANSTQYCPSFMAPFHRKSFYCYLFYRVSFGKNNCQKFVKRWKFSWEKWRLKLWLRLQQNIKRFKRSFDSPLIIKKRFFEQAHRSQVCKNILTHGKYWRPAGKRYCIFSKFIKKGTVKNWVSLHFGHTRSFQLKHIIRKFFCMQQV